MSSNGSERSGTRKRAADRPKTPKGFPLTPHPSGRWCKRIKGKLHYFGRWKRTVNGKPERVENDGIPAALALYDHQLADLLAGRVPRVQAVNADGNPDHGGALTIGVLCDEYFEAQRQKLEAGELSPRTLAEADVTCRRLVAEFGKDRRVDDLRPDDFARLRASLATQYGPVRLANSIGRIRSVFRFAVRRELIERVVRFGDAFDKPRKEVLRKHKAAAAPKMLEASEIRLMLDYVEGKTVTVRDEAGKAKKIKGEANPSMRAMILLGVNGGFGASDLSALPLEAIDLDGGWINFARVKTGVPRRVPLWPETVAALRAAIDARPEPKNPQHAERVFLTVRGLPLVRFDDQSKRDEVAVRFGRLVRKLKLHRPGIGQYALRHTFRTIADESLDQVACMSIMGHSDGTMSGVYRQRISDARLRAVTDHVRAWLLETTAEPALPAGGAEPAKPSQPPAFRVVG